MWLSQLTLANFRNFRALRLEPQPGVLLFCGQNGQGKTNLLEALAYLATLESFRGAPTEALIRDGAQTAVVRAEGEAEGRAVLVEAEVALGGRGRVYVNKQRLQRARDLLGALRVSVFAPVVNVHPGAPRS